MHDHSVNNKTVRFASSITYTHTMPSTLSSIILNYHHYLLCIHPYSCFQRPGFLILVLTRHRSRSQLHLTIFSPFPRMQLRQGICKDGDIGSNNSNNSNVRLVSGNSLACLPFTHYINSPSRACPYSHRCTHWSPKVSYFSR